MIIFIYALCNYFQNRKKVVRSSNLGSFIWN